MSLSEIEALFAGTILIVPDEVHSQQEHRYRAIGQTPEGRHIFVVLTIREHHGKRLIRPISARYMHKKEIIAHEKENPDLRD